MFGNNKIALLIKGGLPIVKPMLKKGIEFLQEYLKELPEAPGENLRTVSFIQQPGSETNFLIVVSENDKATNEIKLIHKKVLVNINDLDTVIETFSNSTL